MVLVSFIFTSSIGYAESPTIAQILRPNLASAKPLVNSASQLLEFKAELRQSSVILSGSEESVEFVAHGFFIAFQAPKNDRAKLPLP